MPETETGWTRNPATGERLAHYPLDGPSLLENRVAGAHQAFREWREWPIERRAEVLLRLARELRAAAGPLARQMTLEMGKPISESRGEVEKCAGAAEWFATHGPAMLADEPVQVEGAVVRVSYLPLGVVLGVMPWNFPLWQPLRATIPILLGGNSFLLKPAPNVIGCALMLRDVFAHTGMPAGLFDVVYSADGDTQAMLGDVRVVGVTVTGSVRAGSALAAAAGRHIKKSVLELGGSDAFIVLADADIAAAAEAAALSRFRNAGQVCIAAKRFLVQRSVMDQFVARFLRAAEGFIAGDPMLEDTRLGPLARNDLREALQQQVADAVRNGAKVLLGGEIPDGPGYFYPATVLVGASRHSCVFQQETFGPVAVIEAVDDADEAIAAANAGRYGLGSSLWTSNLKAAGNYARKIEAGAVFLNTISNSDVRVPIGGVKNSGYGRELSRHGLREFVNVQTVWQQS